jgi:uncharacterized membrane protein YgdD (TMEM256/DUF423 family)
MGGAFWLRIGAISGGLAVAAGAFGAHALRDKLEPRMMEIFQTAVHYQMSHALALVAVGLLAIAARTGMAAEVAGWAFLAGTVLFSGSLYALALSGIRALGAITPFGGVGFLVGWLALAVAAGGALPSAGYAASLSSMPPSRSAAPR